MIGRRAAIGSTNKYFNQSKCRYVDYIITDSKVFTQNGTGS
jgi:hypothetical protein